MGVVFYRPGRAADRRTRETENQQLSCLVQNVRSLKNKLGTLRVLSLVLQRHDILSWTETWLKDHVDDSELQQALGTHVWFRRDRAASSGGGVACAVRASLRPVRRPELERGEALVVDLIGLRSPTTVVTFYRPPDDDAAIRWSTSSDFAPRPLWSHSTGLLMTTQPLSDLPM